MRRDKPAHPHGVFMQQRHPPTVRRLVPTRRPRQSAARLSTSPTAARGACLASTYNFTWGYDLYSLQLLCETETGTSFVPPSD